MEIGWIYPKFGYTKNLVSITEANQNFSEVARLVDERGSVIILKNNVPRYLVMEFSAAEEEQLAADEDIMAISKRLIYKNREAYDTLAKEWKPIQIHQTFILLHTLSISKYYTQSNRIIYISDLCPISGTPYWNLCLSKIRPLRVLPYTWISFYHTLPFYTSQFLTLQVQP